MKAAGEDRYAYLGLTMLAIMAAGFITIVSIIVLIAVGFKQADEREKICLERNGVVFEGRCFRKDLFIDLEKK